MASKRIDLNITGKDNTAGAFQSASKGLQKLGQSANDAGKTVGSALSKGSTNASDALSKIKSSADRTFGTIKAGASAAADSIGGMGQAVSSLLGGFTALQAVQMAWTGSTQREFNEMYLRTKMAGSAADQYLDTIQQIVAQVPGDDTWMNSLLTGALARQTTLTADELLRLGTISSKYVMAAQQTGASILPVNAERELTAYIKTGNTGLMVRDGILKNHVDELQKAKTVQERILALEKAMTEEGYMQMDMAKLTSAKWEEIKGRIQLAATNVGSKLLPFVEKVLDAITDLDSKTNGWSSTIGFVGAALVGLGIAIAPLVTATVAAAVAMKSYANDAKVAAVANAANKGPGVGGTATTTNKGLSLLQYAGAAGVAGLVAAGGLVSAYGQGLGHQATDVGSNPVAREKMTGMKPDEGAKNFGESIQHMTKQWDTFKGKLGNDWKVISSFFKSGGSQISSALGNVWSRIAGSAKSAFNSISNAWGNLKSYISKGVSGTISIFTNGLQSAWNSITGLYNYVRQGVTGVVNIVKGWFGPAQARGPSGPFDNLKLNYEGYAGSKKNAWTDGNSMSGNCVDMSLGLIQAAGSGTLVSGTWNGGPHVWARIGNKDYDPARKALEGTWTPPARGPGDGGNITIYGDVYGFDDFVNKVENAMNKKIRRVY